jgi:hypothetical protein
MQMLIQNGQVSPVLTTLMEAVGLHVEDESPAGVNEILQQKWVKTGPGTVRAQIMGRLPTEEELSLLKGLGQTDAISIGSLLDYDEFVFLGATMKAMARRLKFLIDEICRCQCGTDELPPRLSFLVSHKPIIHDQEGPQVMETIMSETGLVLGSAWCMSRSSDDWPETEFEVAKFLCRMSGLGLDNVTMFACSSSGGKVVNTESTVRMWAESASSDPRRVGVISSQPFCGNQLLAVRRAVAGTRARDYQFSVFGPSAPPLPLARWLDSLAKQLWEEFQLLPK